MCHIAGASIQFIRIKHVHGISEHKFGDEITGQRSGAVSGDGEDTIENKGHYDMAASHKLQPLKHHTTQMTDAKVAAETDTAAITISDGSSNEQILYFANTNVNNNNNVKSKYKHKFDFLTD